MILTCSNCNEGIISESDRYGFQHTAKGDIFACEDCIDRLGFRDTLRSGYLQKFYKEENWIEDQATLSQDSEK